MAFVRLPFRTLALRSQPARYQSIRTLTPNRRLLAPLSSTSHRNVRIVARMGRREDLANRWSSPWQHGSRRFSVDTEAGGDGVFIVDKKYVTRAFSDPSIVVIDVREESEIDETGPLEVDMREAENIPLGQIETALSFDDEDFEEEYGFTKPVLDQEIIFTCRSGVRSDMACRIAAQKGYVNAKNYKGSALEWFAE